MPASAILCLAALWLAVLPREPQDKPGAAPPRDEAFKVAFAHDGACGVFEAGRSCRVEEHWKVSAGDQALDAFPDLQGVLKKEAGARTEAGVSERSVSLHAPDTAPWSLILEAMRLCSLAGIYKIVWRVPEPGKDEKALKVPLPAVPDPPARGKAVLEEIRVGMAWDPVRARTIRRVGKGGEVVSDEDLMSIILTMWADYRKAGRQGVPLLIDATPEVPWRDVVHLVDICQKEKLGRIEFIASLDFGPFEKK
jgi:hypothetical protein